MDGSDFPSFNPAAVIVVLLLGVLIVVCLGLVAWGGDEDE